MIKDELKKIFKEIFANNSLDLTDETSPDDIPEWDSLTQVLLVEEVEKAFNITLNMDDIFKIRTFGDFIKIIKENQK